MCRAPKWSLRNGSGLPGLHLSFGESCSDKRSHFTKNWCEYWVGQFRSDNEKRSRKTTLFYTPWKIRSATLVEHITIKDKSRKAAIYVAAVVVTPRFNSLYQFASM